MTDKWHEMLDHLINKNEDKAKESFQDIINTEKESFNAMMATEAFGDGLTDQQLIGLSAIAKKYMGRKGGNGDALPIGVLKYKDATGVQTDGYDVEEMEAYAKKIGKDWDEWEDETDEFYIQSKISKGLQDAMEKVMGDEDFYNKPVGEKVYDFFSDYEEDDTIEIKVNKFIPLAGDSGSEEVKNLKQVKVDWVVVQNPYQQGGYMDGKEDGGLRDVKVQHDGPWAIYGDSGFEKAISKIVGFEVSFTEQGLQQDGQADMEGFMKNKGVKEDQSMSFEQMDKIFSGLKNAIDLYEKLVGDIEDPMADFTDDLGSDIVNYNKQGPLSSPPEIKNIENLSQSQMLTLASMARQAIDLAQSDVGANVTDILAAEEFVKKLDVAIAMGTGE
jgi:hypothetical protein